MPKSRLQHTVDKYRAALRAHEAQAEQQLEQAYAHVLRTLQPALDKLYDQMVEAMANGQQIPAHFLYEANRLEAIKKLIQGEMDHFGMLSQVQVGQIQHFAVDLGQRSALDMLSATLPEGVRWSFGVPDVKAIANLVGATQRGSPLAELFDGFGREAAEKAGQALITGVTMGWNPRKVAGAVQDALGVSRARALTLSRTSMLNAYRSSNLETYRANDDVCDGWTWVCDLSIRTCAVCIAMSGTFHSLDEEFEGHPNDRCVPVPHTKPWEDILSPLGIDTDIPETSPNIPSGISWFDQQSASVQRQILGNAKYNAYADGALSLKDLIYHGHDADWGGYRQEKSLKDAIGAKKAAKYYGK